MAVIRIEDVDQNTTDLIKDAADRVGMKKHSFIRQLLSRAASKEYAIQQAESAGGE
jgi:hypothetical protein